MWDRERHARETAAYLHTQELARQFDAERGQQDGGLALGVVFDLDLGHCRPRGMLESASSSSSSSASSEADDTTAGPGSGSGGGHAEAKEKDVAAAAAAAPPPPASGSVHVCAADGDLKGLRRWDLWARQQRGQQEQQGRQSLWDAPFPFPPEGEGEGAWGGPGGDDGPPPPVPVGLTPLALAAACSDHVTVDFLLAQGCDPRRSTGTGDGDVGAEGVTVVAPSPAHLAALRDPSALLSLLDSSGGWGEGEVLLHARDCAC